MERVIVVGGGLAGLRTVEALRATGYGGAVTMLAAERHRPYDRPPLSKAVLAGERDATTLDAAWDDLGLDLRTGVTATGLTLAPSGGTVHASDGDHVFDGLVVATGAAPITVPGDGPQHVLRTLDDALELRRRIAARTRLVLVGAGWIGAEVATAAARLGCAVTVLEAADAPLAQALGAELGARTIPWYAEAGVELRTGVKVASVDADGVTLVGGEHVPADTVLTGIGARPDIGWLDGSGLDARRGVLTDGSLRALAGGEPRPDVVAVGDVAEWWSQRYRRRMVVEHWDTALTAPGTAAATLLGETAVYDPVPYFWSEQFGRMVQFAGVAGPDARRIDRGDPDTRDWSVVWVTGDRLDAVLSVARPRDLVQARRIITAGTPVDPERLADPSVPIRSAVRDV